MASAKAASLPRADEPLPGPISTANAAPHAEPGSFEPAGPPPVELLDDDPAPVPPRIGLGEGPFDAPHYVPGYGCGDSCCSDSFGGSSCGGDSCCADFGRLWVRGEFLLWWVDDFSTPPLITASPVGTAREQAGVLGEPGTAVLLGGSDLSDSVRPGGRIHLGYWLDNCQRWGVQASYFGLAQKTSSFGAGSPNDPLLARPFVNVEPGFEGPDAELIAFPDLFDGNIQVHGETTLQGVEVLLRRSLCHDCNIRIDLLTGWRHFDLDEELSISDTRTVTSGQTGLAIGTRLDELDRFATSNRFHGGQLGVVAEMRHCRWFAEGLLKLNLGNNHSEISIDGQAVSTTPVSSGDPEVSTTPAGLLAQQTNIGTTAHDEFTVVPELGLTLGWQLTRCWQATLGYSFIYWSQVARPGEQIDLDLNLSQLAPDGLTGNARPRAAPVFTDFWAQGLSFGLDCQF